MKKLLNFVKTRRKMLSIGLGGVVAGMVISVFSLAHASIPASDGTIHGCRSTTTTLLRVIDSTLQTCDSNEVGLNWSQKGVSAYAHLVYTNNAFSFDANRSYNVSNLHMTQIPPFFKQLCFSVSGTPKNVSITREDDAVSGDFVVALKDENGWTHPQGAACDQVDSSTNVYVKGPGAPFFITIH